MAETDVLDRTSVPDLQVQTTPADTAPAPSSSPSAEDAPSQAQDQGETHQSLLDAVQSAVPELQRTVRADDDGSDASPASFTEKDQSGADVDDDGTLPDEITAEELSKYALSAKRRIRKLGAQRHGLRVEVQRLQALIPQAQVADSVSTFLRDNNISRDDFLLGLKVMGALGTGDIPTARALHRALLEHDRTVLGQSAATGPAERSAPGADDHRGCCPFFQGAHATCPPGE